MFIISGTAACLCFLIVFEIPFLIISINWLFMVTVNHLSVCQLARHQLSMLDRILVHNHSITAVICSSLDFCFPRLLFLRSPGVALKPLQISTIFAGNPLKLIWQLCEVELIEDQIRGADGANGWMECQGIIQSAGSQWDGTFYLALCEGSESARPANRILPWSPGRPIRFRRGHQADQSDSHVRERAVRISPWRWVWMTAIFCRPFSPRALPVGHKHTQTPVCVTDWVCASAQHDPAPHTFLFFSLLLNCFYFIFRFGLI